MAPVIILAILGFILAAMGVEMTFNPPTTDRAKWSLRFTLAILLLCIIGATIWQYKAQANHDEGVNNSIQDLKSSLETNRSELKQARAEAQNLASASQEKIEEARSKMSLNMSEEKVRVLQTDLKLWGEDFTTNRTIFKNRFERFKLEMADAKREQEENKAKAEAQAHAAQIADQEKNKINQIKYTTDVSGQLSFALIYMRGLIDSYANETGHSVVTNIPNGTSIKTNEVLFSVPPMPRNIFTTALNGTVRFPTKAVWKISISSDQGYPLLSISFTDSKGEDSGNLKVYAWREGTDKTHPDVIDLFEIDYDSKFPLPVLRDLGKQLPIIGYESAVIEALQGIVLAQITQAEP